MNEYRETFEANRGYRLSRDGVSLLWMMHSGGQRLTGQELFDFARAFANYLSGIGMPVASPTGYRDPITPANFRDLRNEKMRKYVSRDTWENFISNGSFQLGTTAWYSKTSNDQIRDGHEGLSFVSLTDGERAFHSFVDVGANLALFCGTAPSNPSTEIMAERFGEVAIEIEIAPFAERVADKIGATDFLVHDICYSDAKTFLAEEDIRELDEFARSLPSQMTPEQLHELNCRAFDFLYRAGLFASVFCKPETRYAQEVERRIAFVFERDVGETPITLTDSQLLDYVGVVGQTSA